MKSKTFFAAVVLVVLGVLTRLAPHPANFTALGAIALWAMTLIPSRPLALVIPLFTLVLSDLWIGFHDQVGWVYGAFVVVAALSLWIQPRQSWGRTLGGSLIASLVFFFITNFGFWAQSGMYPMNAGGLLESYFAGLPFLKNQIAGDLFFSGVLGLVVRALIPGREAATRTA